MFVDGPPSVSVVVPTKNRPDEIARMLRSLRAQPSMPLEVIVVDQSMPAYVLEPFPQLVHIQDPQISGLTAARNRGVDNARGDVILFFDDDVILETDCVREIALAFGARPDLVGAQCSIHNPWDDFPLSPFEVSERIFRHGFFDPRPKRQGGEVIPRLIDGLASAYRRDLFERERFDEMLPGYGLAEDWDMTKRAALHGALTILPAARVRHEPSPKNRLDLAAVVKLRRTNFLYLYDKLSADRDPRNRLWKNVFLLGEALRGIKHKITGETRRSLS
jgi:glycosyltransferase involved in cell wall biosynthesis